MKMMTQIDIALKIERDLEYFESEHSEGKYCVIKTSSEKRNYIRIGKIAFRETEQVLGKNFTRQDAIWLVATRIHNWMLDGKIYACRDGFSHRPPIKTYFKNIIDWVYAPFKRWYLINVILKDDRWKIFKKD